MQGTACSRCSVNSNKAVVANEVGEIVELGS